MIVRVTSETARIGFRLRDWKNSRFLTDWRNLQLIIRPGQSDQPCWVPGGSPLILHGYWPGIPTEVDLANPPPPDFPAMVMPAWDRGEDCTVVFLLHDRFHALPYGRYTGILRWCPDGPVHVVNYHSDKKPVPPDRHGMIPPKYHDVCARYCRCQTPPPEPPKPPYDRCCDLGVFDIDLGPRCDEHIIDLVTVEYALNHCEEEC